MARSVFRALLLQFLLLLLISYVSPGTRTRRRPQDRSCYVNGMVQYDRLARTSLFQDGLRRVAEGLKTHRVAYCSGGGSPGVSSQDPNLPPISESGHRHSTYSGGRSA